MADLSQINIDGKIYSIKDVVARQSGGGGLSQLVIVTAEDFAEETITLTNADDGTTLTKTADANGVAKFNVSSAGTWTATADDSGTTVTLGSVTLNVSNINYSQQYRVMTVVIDQNESDPTACCTYADDAVRMTAGSSDWDEFFGHFPCLLQNGVMSVKLNPNDFTKDIYGNNVDITSGSSGDVMIAFPRMGLRISTDASNKVTVSMTDDPNHPDFEYNAHTRGTTAKDVFYLGAYKGYELNSKLRSLSGKTITANKTIGAFRTSAQANGVGYEQSGFYQLIFRQAMFILKYKTLNSQSAVGMGYVLSSHTAAIATGGTEAYGMDCEDIKNTNPTYMTDQNHHVKLFGIEDFWGNVWEWIDGFVTNSLREILTANSDFNDIGSGYTNNGQGATSDIASAYISKVQGGTKTGFIVKEVSGSSSTYYTDFGGLLAGKVGTSGGGWFFDTNDGVFHLNADTDSSIARAYIAARLMYL